MSNRLTEFMDSLKSEVKAYKTLHQVLKNEKEALIKWDIDAATLTLFKKDEIVSEIQELENTRMEKALRVAEELFPGSQTEQPPTLKKIIETLAGPIAHDLEEFRNEQIKLVTEVRTLNARNSLLMKRTVELISGSINSMTGGEQTTPLYDDKGNYKNTSASAKLIDGTI